MGFSNGLQKAPSNSVNVYVTMGRYTSTNDQWAHTDKKLTASVQFSSVTCT